jgi:hypothetical protein
MEGKEMNYTLTKEETETTIDYNDAEKEAILYTCNKALTRKMDRLMEKYPETYRLIRQDECSKTYIFPKRYVRIGSPVILSEKQKENLERLKANRFKFNPIGTTAAGDEKTF